MFFFVFFVYKDALTLILTLTAYNQYEAVRGIILVYEYTLVKFKPRFDYTWIIRVCPAPPGGPN